MSDRAASSAPFTLILGNIYHLSFCVMVLEQNFLCSCLILSTLLQMQEQQDISPHLGRLLAAITSTTPSSKSSCWKVLIRAAQGEFSPYIYIFFYIKENTDSYFKISARWTHLNILQWLNVKCGEQQQVADPGQSRLLQLSHWKVQAQVNQHHTNTFDPQHTAGC